MRRRTEATIVTVFLAVNIVVLTCGGVLASLRQYAGGMGLCFFLAVYCAQCCVCFLLNHRIESRFLRLETVFSGESVPDRIGSKFVPKSDIISMLIFHAVALLLAIHALNRGWWLVLCVLLAVFLVGNFVYMALAVWLKVKACSKRLEELFSNSKERAMRAEPGKL
ncbi:MAG: hypothetical protein AMJ65_17300 [Phycisphaerae bacterium SG8_4]|nr:MAG: hypothetical protein AMJ65_17300 [Phycisphaerae bacterium SG8_4]